MNPAHVGGDADLFGIGGVEGASQKVCGVSALPYCAVLHSDSRITHEARFKDLKLTGLCPQFSLTCASQRNVSKIR